MLMFAEMYVNVVFVIRCLYSAVSLTLVKEQGLIRFFILLLLVVLVLRSAAVQIAGEKKIFNAKEINQQQNRQQK